MKDLISVIIPVYKVEDYLERCVNSILEQSYTTMEIILVDDGSPDRCGTICDEFASRDQRIKVIHQANGGLSSARNRGLDQATGKYVTFLDSDDWVVPDYLTILHALMIEYQADITIGNFNKVTNETPIAAHQGRIKVMTNLEALEQLETTLYLNMVVAWGKLYRRELFSNLSFPVGKIHEDEFITYRLLYQSNKVVYTNQPLVYYWQRPDSIMGVGFKLKNRLHYIAAAQAKCQFYRQLNQPKLIRNATRKLFFAYQAVRLHAKQFTSPEELQAFMQEYQTFKIQFNDSHQSPSFMIYARLCFLMPSLTTLYPKINQLKTQMTQMIMKAGK